MKLIRHPDDLDPSNRGSVAALGNFDGFHRGHQVVVGEAGRIARELGRPLAVLATEPHPRSFFAPDAPAFRLTPFRERAHLFEVFGADLHFLLGFDAELAATSAESFVRDILHDGFGISHVVAGFDYRFGNRRKGDVALLRGLCAELGIGVTIVEPVSVGVEGTAGEVYSSTLVREALQAGEARRAAALLGHWWSVNGRVVEGDKRGRQIGFPTANIDLHESIVPGLGVYAVRVFLEGEAERPRDGVANVGNRPTFDGKGIVLEVYLFDFDGDLYDRHLRVEFVGHIRDEARFDGLDALKAQIAKDCVTARQVLADPENLRDHLQTPTLDAYLARFPEPPGQRQ